VGEYGTNVMHCGGEWGNFPQRTGLFLKHLIIG
jgi:hypothetical protein